jgi:hypothetical protein
MARLCMTVEGQTEQMFVNHLLRPHLASRGVYVTGARLTAFSRKKRHVHRGGVRAYAPVKNDLDHWLKEDRGPDAFFTTMIDLYGLPKNFPGYEDGALAKDPYKRVGVLEEAFAKDIGDRRFIPYIQLHEFEALLLSDPAAFACYYENRPKQIQALVELRDGSNNPELIDDGEQSAPSKRIAEHIPEYPQAKPSVADIVAAGIGLDTMRGSCPHFHQWLTKLEQLGTSATENR